MNTFAQSMTGFWLGFFSTLCCDHLYCYCWAFYFFVMNVWNILYRQTYVFMYEWAYLHVNQHIYTKARVFLCWKCLPSWSIYTHGRKLNAKIKFNVKSARQPINLAYILLSFLDRQNSSFPFFFKIKHQETTYTVRFFFPPSLYYRNEFCKCSILKTPVKAIKTCRCSALFRGWSFEESLTKICMPFS